MARYELCPRCQLNFIDADKEDFCEVCKMELNGEKTFTDNFEEADTEETELCPICGENYMRAGEKMCDECKKKSEYEEDIEEEEEEETQNSDDDFEYVSADDYLDDEDDDDEDDEDDSFDDDDAPSPKSGASKKRRRNDDDF